MYCTYIHTYIQRKIQVAILLGSTTGLLFSPTNAHPESQLMYVGIVLQPTMNGFYQSWREVRGERGGGWGRIKKTELEKIRKQKLW